MKQVIQPRVMSTPVMFSNSYGELGLDDFNVYEFEFPLTSQEYEEAVNKQIAREESYSENQIRDYYS